jgi:hypothetical protein
MGWPFLSSDGSEPAAQGVALATEAVSKHTKDIRVLFDERFLFRAAYGAKHFGPG